MIYVVGLGPGNSNYLTTEGKACIEVSDVIIGGKRNLESLTEFQGEKVKLSADLQEMLRFITAHEKEMTISVLASGDPLIYGIGKYLSQNFTKEQLKIIPGISAVQYFFSQIPLDMNDLYITSSHGKEPNFDKILSYEKVAMVTDKIIGPSEIASEILRRGLKKVMFIGENLSYENERIIQVKPEEVIGKNFDMNVVVIVDEK